MAPKRRPEIDAAKQFARKQAKALSHHSRRAARSTTDKVSALARFVLPNRRNRARDTSSQLRQYANLNKRGKSSRLNRGDAKRRKKAEYLASLPKHPLKRFLYRMHPKRFFAYWFSKNGATTALKLGGIGLAVALVSAFSVFAYFRRDLPNPRDITFEQAAKVYDRTGKTLLYTYGSSDQIRVLVEFDQISDYMKWATIAIEDKDFYKHGGFSVSGVARATYNNVFNPDDSVQGGSTITQQFIKNALVGDERTFTRKVKELILAIELERLYTKDEILSFYLNQIPYGALEYGVEATANGFFNKSANDLSLDEAALIAALPQAPSYYSPYGPNTEDLVGRQHYIIDLMADQGYVSREDADKAKQVNTLKKVIPTEKRTAYRNLKAPHFVLKVIDDLIAEYGEATVQRGGLTVTTTIDLKAQKIAEDAVKNRYRAGGAMGDNASLVAEDTATGQVIAYVGSRDFNYKGYGIYDAATPEIGRQPGSSFKPYAYAEMFKNPRWSPGSIIWDSSTNFNGYAPHDFDFRFPGPMTVRDAIGRSRNIPAVKALYIAGVDKTIEAAQNMGLKTLCDSCDYGLSLVLGAGEVKLSEHVHGFGTFGRGGVYKPQTYILKVTNSNNEVLREWKDDEGEQVVDEEIAYLMTSILTDDVARSGTFGLGSRLVVPGYTVAAKTGTTDLSVDGWLMGYSKYVSAGVWVGNHDSKPMYTFAEPMVGPIWNDFMVNYHKGKKDVKFERPDGIKNVKIDRASGRNASASSKIVINDIAPSWFKGVASANATKITIDTISNKLATDCTPELAKKEVTDNGIAPELPSSDPMFSAWAKGAGYSASGTSIKSKDDVHKCSDVKPEITNFSVTGNGGVYNFEADYNEGDFDLEKVNFKVNGAVVSSCSVGGGGCSDSHAEFEYDSTIDGNVTVVVEIIDEVLYSDDATENTSFTSGSLSINHNCSGPPIAFNCDMEWTDLGTTYDLWYGNNCNGSPNVSNYNDNQFQFDANNGEDYCFRVRASGGDPDEEIEFEA